MQEINFVLNGIPRRLLVDPQKNLLKVIREDLKLTGTKEGCSAGHCGTCAVLVDREVVLACRYPVIKTQGKEVMTIEGIGTLQNPHPIQLAFAKMGAIQCGFCTPGMLLSAKNLLDQNPQPSIEEIKVAISGVLCRCTGYQKIIHAIHSVSKTAS